MGIKAFQDREEMSEKLNQRGLKYSDVELDEAILNYNYFNIFNGFETLLLIDSNQKVYNGETLKDFIDLYKFDKNLSSEILKLVMFVENKLKNSIAYHFSKQHCNNKLKTMEYTNKDNYIDPQTRTNYPFQNFQYKALFRNFDNFDLFKEDFLHNLIKYNDHINSTFYRDREYGLDNTNRTTHPFYQRYDYSRRRFVDEDFDVAVPLWVAIETFEFGTLLRMVHYLDDGVLEQVLKDFNITINHRNQFLNMLDVLKALRNSCAHGKLINRFRTLDYLKLDSILISTFSLNPITNNTSTSNSRPPSSIRLFDALKILSFFVDTKDIYKIVQSIIYRNNKKFKGEYDINTRLLSRMGETNLSEWKIYIKNRYPYQF